MTRSILFTRNVPGPAIELLRNKGYEVDVRSEDSIPSQEEIITLLQKKPYDALVSLLTDKIDGAIFDKAPSVKMVINYATGYDNIDVKEALERGITVANAPAESTSDAVAEHTVALMLGLAARIVEADEAVRRGQYKGWSPTHFIGTDLKGKTLGIIGAGRIGTRLGRYAKGLSMNLSYFDRAQNNELDKEGATYLSSVEEILKTSDVVSLHVPLLPTTHHLINKERFSLMKPTSFLINTSRGPIVEEKALEEALANGTIAAAALDVFEFEPEISPTLLAMQNVILTPHIASASDSARNEMSELVAENLIDFFEGREPKNAIKQ